MPLIEPVARCRKFNALRRDAQWFYLQLKTVLDPAGRHDAHPGILNSTLFPLRKDVRDTDITRWLRECESAGLSRCYADGRGRAVVEVFDARQTRMKAIKSEYDDPGGQAALFSEVKGREEKRSRVNNSARGSEEVEKSVSGPTVAQVLECASRIGVAEASARAFFNHHEENNLWLNRFDRLVNWQAKLKSWGERDKAKPYESRSATGKYENNATINGKRVDRNKGTANSGGADDYANFKK